MYGLEVYRKGSLGSGAYDMGLTSLDVCVGIGVKGMGLRKL